MLLAGAQIAHGLQETYMAPVTQIRGFMPFTAIVLLQAAVAIVYPAYTWNGRI